MSELQFVASADIYREILRREICLASFDAVAMYDRALRRGVDPVEAFDRVREYACAGEDRFHAVVSRRRPLRAPFAWRNTWHRPHAGGWS